MVGDVTDPSFIAAFSEDASAAAIVSSRQAGPFGLSFGLSQSSPPQPVMSMITIVADDSSFFKGSSICLVEDLSRGFPTLEVYCQGLFDQFGYFLKIRGFVENVFQ